MLSKRLVPKELNLTFANVALDLPKVNSNTARTAARVLSVVARSVALLIAILFLSAPDRTCAQTPSSAGFVDTLRYEPLERRILLAGWAAPANPSVFTSNIVVAVGGQEIYRGRFQRLERPDVVAATGRRDWLWSGWQIEVRIPHGVPSGQQRVNVHFRLTNGEEIDLLSAQGVQSIEVRPQNTPSKRAIAAFLAAVLLPLLTLVWTGTPARMLAQFLGRKVAPLVPFAVAVGLSFFLLVAAGITGSSLRLALQTSPVTIGDVIDWYGKGREIRSDEWRVLTPMAIGQFNHDPPYPVVNRNVGSDGQNMLVIGMTGVPVAHVSAFAKPATWGFFLFDLRRALAWYWWFPFFACFAAVWALLIRTFSIDWRVAAALAATVAASPYSVAFSGWPAYTVFFPAAAVVAADTALRVRRVSVALLSGALAGLSVAGFALVLYPAWQISLTYLLVPFAIAAFLVHRRHLLVGRVQLAAAAVAAIVAGFVLAAWWHDARDAITALRETVYPGQRTAAVGGDIDRWFLVKGLISPVTMYSDSALMDPSDAGSFVFLLLPLSAAVFLSWIAARRVEAVSAALLAFVAAALVYMYAGFGAGLAEHSLWGRTTPYRMDLALGVAQTLLLAWMIASAQRPEVAEGPWVPGIATIASLAIALYCAAMFRLLPIAIGDMVSPPLVLLCCVAIGILSYMLLRHRLRAAVVTYSAWMLGTAVPFNPLGQAPTAVAPGADWSRTSVTEDRSIDERRLAIIGEHSWTVTLVAAGEAVVNTVMYYPQASLWERLDPSGTQRIVYNRYQHLLFELAPLSSETAHQIDSPRLDVVRVTLDPARFDFRLLPAGRVLASIRNDTALVANPSLKKMAAGLGWTLYRVVR